MHIPPRYELKYLVAPEQLPALREELSTVCSLDRHSLEAEGHRYLVTTLYLDTPDLAFYRAGVDRSARRLKLRVRRYEGERSPVLLEVKRKDGEIVRKTRAVGGADWAERMHFPAGADPALHDFAAVLARTHAEPRLLVRYRREAWVSEIDEYGRVTFDSALEYQPWDRLSLDGEPGGFIPLDDSATLQFPSSALILELKFAERAPAWMMTLVRRFDLLRRGFSKYTAGVDQLWGRRRPYDRWLRQARWG